MEEKKDGDEVGDEVTITSSTTIPQKLYRFHGHRRNQVDDDDRPFLTDVDIVCKGGYVPAHSVVLMSGSPVLKEHIMSQSRGQRDHTVVHLLDYDIADVTHVITCLYTGTCTFPQNQTDPVLEVFKVLGVGIDRMTCASATSEDSNKKSRLRQYLDLSDDDDKYIEDGEVIAAADIPPNVFPESSKGPETESKTDELPDKRGINASSTSGESKNATTTSTTNNKTKAQTKKGRKASAARV